MPAIVHDLRYALRQLRRSPAFALTAVLTLGLGLGGAATMYTVVHDALLAPLPYPHPEQLVGLSLQTPQDTSSAEQIGAGADYLAHHSRSFRSTGIAEDGNTDANLSCPGQNAQPALVHMRPVSSGYLPTLGIAPALGRNFTAKEDSTNGPKAVLLSDALWRSRFNGDRSIVGKAIHLDEQAFTVVGVLPASFRDSSTSEPTDVWEPLALSPAQPGYDGDNYVMVGRLREGVSLAAAQGELDALTSSFLHDEPQYLRWTRPGSPHLQYRVFSLAAALTSNVRGSLLTVSAAVALVLLLACFNLAGLFGTRVFQRRGELQLRAALGAGRAQLLRLVLSEAALLASGAALVAGLCSALARPALLAGSPVPLPVLGASGAIRRLLFLSIASFAATLLFAVLPAVMVVRRGLGNTARSVVGGNRAESRIGAFLVAVQACFAAVLLAGAALLLGAFLKLQSTSPGFSTQHLITAQVALRGSVYNSTTRTSQFIEQVLEQLGHTPGVTSVAAIDGLPLRRGLNIGMEPVQHPEQLIGVTELRPVTPGYFGILGLRLVAGRPLTPSDTAHSRPVAVISQTAARLWWPGQNPIGQQVRYRGNEPFPMLVVGVVSDTHANSLAEPFTATVYAPYAQLPDSLTRIVNRWISTDFVLRVADGVPVARVIDQAVHTADPEIPVTSIATLPSIIRKSNAAPRFFSWLSGAFASFALLLTMLGLFGLLSYQVAQRTRELGLRIAVGATRENILFSVIRRGVLLTSIGLTLGIALSLLLPTVVASMLATTVRTGDAPASTLLAHPYLATLLSALLLLAAALAACSLPAWRASRIDPMQALRTE